MYVFIIFVIKYDYFCIYLRNCIIIHIDYKALICFLRADFYKSIYEH